MSTVTLAIDPGASGGIAMGGELFEACAIAMPDGMTAMVDWLREQVRKDHQLRAVVEKVGNWMPGDHPNAATKFARHCGHIEAALYALGIPFTEVAPGVWQRSLGVLPRDKMDRKRAIKELMQRRYPHLRVTLKTADALGILTWSTSATTPPKP